MPLTAMKELIVILFIFVLGSVSEDFHPSRTLLMDYYPRSSTPRNFLFRGNMPIINESFAYNEIITAMSVQAEKHNLTLPVNFTLNIISYLNEFEYSDLETEKNFFHSNPKLGKMYNKVLIGSLIKPPQNDTKLIKSIVKDYIEKDSFDKLPNLMEFLRDQIMQNETVLIYTHCEAGTDRTGEASGAYYMTYLNMTFSEALDIDNHVQSRDMNFIMVRQAASPQRCYVAKSAPAVNEATEVIKTVGTDGACRNMMQY